jgi:hypothetical protein
MAGHIELLLVLATLVILLLDGVASDTDPRDQYVGTIRCISLTYYYSWCSSSRSAKVRDFLKDTVFVEMDNAALEMPTSCPFHASNDILGVFVRVVCFLPHPLCADDHRVVTANDEGQCAIQ